MNSYERLVHTAGGNFYRYHQIYQSGGSPVKISAKDKKIPYEEKIKRLAEFIREADAILVGTASGMSTAAGQDFYYGNTESFRKYFGQYGKKYGYAGTFDGVYYNYRTREEFWGFMAHLLHHTLHAPLGDAYKDLAAILEGKDFHVVTTNQDTQITKLYPDDKVSTIQGDERYMQCSGPCRDEVFRSEEIVDCMEAAIDDNLQLPTDKIPRCPHCGRELRWWVRGPRFLEETKYHEEYDKIEAFINRHKEEKLLFLELGVGRMTPMFIQEPFWNLTLHFPKAAYASINARDAILPEQIEKQGTAIHEDIAKALKDTLREL